MLTHKFGVFTGIRSGIPRWLGSRFGVGGFSLLEVLATLAVIGVLAGVLLESGGRAQEHALRAQARAELRILAQGLESYRQANGDYPRTDAPPADPLGVLTRALFGDDAPPPSPERVRRFIPVSLANQLRRRYARLDEPSDPHSTDGVLRDPWGSPYVYRYPSSGDAFNATFDLYSYGPDRRAAVGRWEERTPPKSDGRDDIVWSAASG